MQSAAGQDVQKAYSERWFWEKNYFWQVRYLGADFRGSTTRIQKLFSLRQVQEVEQTLGVLTFCVVSLVILQTRSYEQHATKFTMLQNDKYLCFYGSKRHKMFPLDQQYDARSIWDKKINFCKQFLQKHMKNHMKKKRRLSALPLALVVEKKASGF